MLQVLKQNSLLLDVASTKYQISIICPKLLSSPIPSMWLEKSSNCLSILTKFSQLLSFLIFVVSSNIMKTIPSSSGSVQAILNSIFTMMLIKKLRPLTQLYFIHTKYHGILARKVKVTTSWKWRSKLLILKETTFWTYSTMTIILLNHHISKMDYGSKLLATQIHYICMLQELSQIMLLSVNMDLGFFLGKNLSVCVTYTLLNQDIIFFMTVVDLMVIGIREGTH